MHCADAAQLFVRQFRDAQLRQTVLHPGADRRRDGGGLLVDLLEHKVGVAALFGCFHVPVCGQLFALHRLAELVIEADALCRAHRHVPFFQHAVAAGVLEQRRDIRCHKVFALAPAHDERAFPLDRKDGVRVVLEQNRQRVAAPHLGKRSLQSPQRLALIATVDELYQHLGVSLAGKGVAFGDKALLQSAVVFNNAVVHDADPGRGVRVAVHIAGLAVGRPAGMTDAAAALGQRQLFQFAAQGGEPPLAFDHADAVPLGKRHTGRIVPAVLQLFQTVQQHLLGAAHPDITYNATHTKYLQTDCGAPKCAAAQSVSSIKVYVLVWLSLQGSVPVLLPVFALFCGWYSPQPEKHPPNLSMIPLLVTLTAVTRVARRFASACGTHSFFQSCLGLSASPAFYAIWAATSACTAAADCTGRGRKGQTPRCPYPV